MVFHLHRFVLLPSFIAALCNGVAVVCWLLGLFCEVHTALW